MMRTRLRNRFLQYRSDENPKRFCKQRNECLSLHKNLKRSISESYTRKTLQITKLSRKPSNPSRQKKFDILKQKISLKKMILC